MRHYGRFDWVKSRLGFIILLVFLFWLKSMMAYIMDFHLFSGASIIQIITIIINPLPLPLLFIGLAFYFRKSRYFYPIAIFMAFLNTLLLYLNVIYYREFTDFMSVSTMLGYNKVNQGLSASGLALANIHDLFFWLDFVIIIGLFLFKKIKPDHEIPTKFMSFAFSTLGIFLFMLTLTLGEIDRPQLIGRQFDSNYMVKYLGIDAFTISDGVRLRNISHERNSVKKTDVQKALDYIDKHNLSDVTKYQGVAKGKNVFVIHLESFQQFVIDLQVNGQEVTPFINSLYHSDSTLSFNNFFNQVGQGKTSDAENMLETGTFGLPSGSLFASHGSDQTFQAMPAILHQNQDYSSAVFHGNNASFWNRNNVYKNMGYQYFFDASYYDTSGDKAMGYGLKDKLLFNDSIKYLERLQQPFYAKYITVTNHFPYTLDDRDKDSNFQTTSTDSDVVNGYFETNHYLDQSIQEFYNYLDKSGLADNSMIVLYGDHYGISNSENKSLAPVIGKSAEDWTDWDNQQLQRVPFMINMPGWHGGGIDETYGGEVDVMPTLLRILGVNKAEQYVNVGQNLLNPKKEQIVAFRNNNWTTPKYSRAGDTIYDHEGKAIETLTAKQQSQVDKIQAKVDKQLSVSDSINQKDLLRFYTPKKFQKIQAQKYNYAHGLGKLENLSVKLGDKATDLYHQHGDTSTVDLYQTDAPEKSEPHSDTSRITQQNPDDVDKHDAGLDNEPNP
ncbi:LTA synthase family protein [Weissella coleopterorum]|uniref:LTA synthase family protein n=1 Tax=Weissella coleopterorum TaxID=2714949 RepID=A0A6G8B1Q4_9LACO|nr:LTA synthase family protein [Weissella coleopterorum]QIL51244.1 LTA synthase family protein [Weissella coleopterorum]